MNMAGCYAALSDALTLHLYVLYYTYEASPIVHTPLESLDQTVRV